MGALVEKLDLRAFKASFDMWGACINAAEEKTFHHVSFVSAHVLMLHVFSFCFRVPLLQEVCHSARASLSITHCLPLLCST